MQSLSRQTWGLEGALEPSESRCFPLPWPLPSAICRVNLAPSDKSVGTASSLAGAECVVDFDTEMHTEAFHAHF